MKFGLSNMPNTSWEEKRGHEPRIPRIHGRCCKLELPWFRSRPAGRAFSRLQSLVKAQTLIRKLGDLATLP